MKKAITALAILFAFTIAGMAGMSNLDSLTLGGTSGTADLTFSNGATITNTNATTLTITETNISLVGVVSFTGNLAQDGTTLSLDGSTSVRGISAGFVSLEAPDIRFGFDASDYMKLVTTTGTGALAITHVGGTAPDVTWTADSWALTGDFEIVGTTVLDDFSASGLADLDGGIAVDTSNFTVDGTSGTIVTAADIDVQGSDITNTTAGGGIHLEPTAAADGDDIDFVEITGTVAAHSGSTPTSRFLEINPTIGIPTVENTVNLIDMVFTTPVYGTACASTLRGIYFDPTIGAATAGTNNLVLFDVAAIDDSDDELNIYGIRMGAMTGAAGTENAIEIGAGWDQGFSSASPISLAHTTPPNLVLDNTTTGADADSAYVIWRGNDGAADTELDMSVFLDIESTTDYKLSFMDDGQSAEVASIDQDGDLQIDGDLTVDGGDITVNSDYQPITEYIAFDIEEATMDADDGTGIKVESLTLDFTGVILSAFVNVTQGYSEAGDTIELIINDTDDVTSATTTLVSATDTSAAHLLAYEPTTGATVLGAISSTDKYVVVIYKDVGNDGSTAANLQGTLIVTYLKQ